VRGQVVRVNIRTPEEIAKYRGKLSGKIVLFGEDPEVKPSVQPLSERYNEQSLHDIEQYEIPSERSEARLREFRQRRRMQRELNRFWDAEKVIAVIDHSRGDIGGGTVFVQSGGSCKVGETVATPQLTMAVEHWNRIARILNAKKDVELELNVKSTFYDDAMTQYDTIAEIPGTDKKDEVVMLGASGLVALRDRRYRQWRGKRGYDGGRSDPQGAGCQAATHHSHRTMERRGARPFRFAMVCFPPLRDAPGIERS
jgi:hypothetical protein